MPWKFSPFTGTLDFYSNGTGVQGPGLSTDNAITRWDGTTGDVVQNSKTILQDGGAIEAQGFITRRSITDLVVIPDGESWIAPSLELELTGSIELEFNAELIII